MKTSWKLAIYCAIVIILAALLYNHNASTTPACVGNDTEWQYGEHICFDVKNGVMESAVITFVLLAIGFVYYLFPEYEEADRILAARGYEMNEPAEVKQ